MKVLVCLTALFAATSAVDIECPNLSVVNDFNTTSWAGTWYKQYGLNTPFEIGSCAQVTYTNNDDGDIDVAARLKTILGGTAEVSGSAVVADADNNGILNVTMHTYVGDIDTPMWILSTDYDTFAIVYHCTEVRTGWFSFPYESVWVMTRDRDLTVDTELLIIEAMNTIADEGGPSMALLSPVSQENCS